MSVRRALRGPNAGGLFWGCDDHPRCRGLRAHPGENGVQSTDVSDESRALEIGSPPECPKGHGPMVLKVARTGRWAGQRFWSCSSYPACKHLVNIDEGGNVESEGLGAKTRARVNWVDATLDRRGWTCRYTTIGGSLRSLPSSAEVSARVSQAWIARTEALFPSDPDVQRIVGLCRKLLQRGTAPPIDPVVERSLVTGLGLSSNVVDSPLPGDLAFRLEQGPSGEALTSIVGWGAGDVDVDPTLKLDSEEEGLALHSGFGGAIPSQALRWVVPQASFEALAGTTGQVAARRVDFLVSVPWADPFVIEVDGQQHDRGTEAVDADRDEQLAEAGLLPLRIDARAVTEPGRLWRDEVRARVGTADGAGDRVRALVYGPAQIHRCALALLEAIGAGFLVGDRWVVEVHDDLGVVGDSVLPYLGLFAAMDRLWGGGAAPSEFVYSINGRWRRAVRRGVSYVDPADCAPDRATVCLHLEAGRSSTERLPDSDDLPKVVVRSAFLPVRLADPVYEGPRRAEVQTEGEEIEEALVYLLRAIFAKESFREGQIDALMEVIEGRDCAVLLPTGAGKSLIYQLAGLCLPGRTLVVDPLVSLMEDQVEGLAQNGIDRVALLSSYVTQQGLADQAFEEISSGEVLFAFVSPERLQQARFRTALRSLAEVSPINLAVVDEAHCVSEWGHEFRTAYLNLGRLLRRVCRDAEGVSPPLLALTGTASRAVLRDVLIELGIERDSERAVIRPRTFDRPELRYSIRRVEPPDAEAALLGFLRRLPGEFGVPATDFFRPRGDRTFSGLVFCPNVNGKSGIVDAAETIRPLLEAPPPMFSGSTAPKTVKRADWERTKRRNAFAFKQNQTPLLVSTKAFGMGIDKPNIRYVVHYGIPGSIEGYYQEVGRGGRDRERAECGLILVEYDEDRARQLLDEDSNLVDIRASHAQIRWAENDDISRQLFFHLGSFRGIQDETAIVAALLSEIGPIDRRRTIELPRGRTDHDAKARERGLHRLIVLGVLDDYLVDWGASTYTLELAGIDAESVVERLLAYVGRNQPARVEAIGQTAASFRASDVIDACAGCSRILIEFVYDTIERSRRRSLREMWLAARESERDPNSAFRQRILDYLSEGDISPVLERLVDSAQFRYADWMHELSQVVDVNDARELRGNAARLLSSYPDHPGMLLARGFSELADTRGNLREFTSALDSSLSSARSRYGASGTDLDQLVAWLVQQSEVHRRPSFRTAALSVAVRMGVAEATVERELRASLSDPEGDDAGALVLSLAAVLDGVLSSLNGTETANEGVIA